MQIIPSERLLYNNNISIHIDVSYSIGMGVPPEGRLCPSGLSHLEVAHEIMFPLIHGVPNTIN